MSGEDLLPLEKEKRTLLGNRFGREKSGETGQHFRIEKLGGAGLKETMARIREMPFRDLWQVKC